MSNILTTSGNGENGWRTNPLYTISEAAHFAQVPPMTVRRWLYGDQTPNARMQPVFGGTSKATRSVEVSFLQLAEIFIVSQFRRKNISLQRIRKAHQFARNTWQSKYPFARFSLATDGVRILRRFEEAEPGASLLVLAPESAQWTLPQYVLPQYVSEAIQAFEFQDDLASRWFPVGKTVPIVIDPQFSAGLPTIPDRRLTIHAIRNRWKSGQSMDFIAEDYMLKREVVEEALRYAERVLA